jgi:hypothetical protein
MSTTTNHLFFIAAKTVDGDSQDLHVVAADAVTATEFWRSHYELDADDSPEWVRPIPGVTPTCAPGAIGWEVINPA